jgi:hypothetical protein
MLIIPNFLCSTQIFYTKSKNADIFNAQVFLCWLAIGVLNRPFSDSLAQGVRKVAIIILNISYDSYSLFGRKNQHVACICLLSRLDR